MKDELPQLAPRKSAKPKHQQVTELMRERLLSGELPSGTVLPTIHQLADQLGTSYFTVQAALTPLVEEGLLERKRRVGTIVRHNPTTITRAAIYASTGILTDPKHAFHSELCRQLQLQLGAEGIVATLHTDMRSHDDTRTPLPALAESIEEHRIQALFVVICDVPALTWLKKLPIAASFATFGKIPNRVIPDGRQRLRLALSQLQARGCRRVGIVSSALLPDFAATIGDSGGLVPDPRPQRCPRRRRVRLQRVQNAVAAAGAPRRRIRLPGHLRPRGHDRRPGARRTRPG